MPAHDAQPPLLVGAPASEPPPKLRRALIRSTAHVAFGTFVSQGSSLLRTFLAARILGPSVYGIWLGLRLVVDYGAALDLGVLAGVLRNVPLLRGRGEERSAEEVKQTAFSFVVLMGTIAALVVGLVASRWPNPRERSVLFGISALLVGNLVRGYFVSIFKATHRFRETAAAFFCGSMVCLATIPLLWPFGLGGFVWGMVAQAVTEAGYLALRAGAPRPSIRWQVLKAQLAFGLPATAILFGVTLLTSIDRTLILQKLDADWLGRYGIAYIVLTILTNLAAIPNSVLSPRFPERLGQTNRPADLGPLLVEPLRPIGLCFAAVVGAVAIALPPVVHLLLPKYDDGIVAAQVITVGTYALVVIGVAASCIVSLHRLKIYFLILVATAGFTYLLGRLGLWLHPALVSVAAAVAIGQLAYMTAAVLAAHRLIGDRLAVGLRTLGIVFAPLAVVVACVIAVETAGRLLHLHPLAVTGLGELCLLGSLGPSVLRTARRLRA